MLRHARVPLLSAVLIATAIIAVACGGDDDSASNGSGGAPAAGQVNIADFRFSPNTLTAKAGQALSLNVTNTGQQPHTFTITNLVDSGTLSAGQSKALSFTPSAAGTLTFLCTIHGAGTMSGTITVAQ